MKTAVLLLSVVALFVVHCSHHQQKPDEPSPSSVQKGLTREANDLRAKRVRHPLYALHLDLDEKNKNFNGTVTLDFDLEEANLPLRIDFQNGVLKKLMINNAEVQNPDYNGQYILLPAGPLKIGRNSVTVEYTHPYSSSGKGLQRFEDPEDHKVYLYTDFEPYDANQLFPCFDQPDLKGQYTLTVEAPKDWKVISSTRENRIENTDDQRKVWTFPQTMPFSTYLFSVHAGPYKVWSSHRGKVPLRLFARQAMAKYVLADEWLDVTKNGLEFYGKFFNYPYAFKKYDQVVAPDFNEGAMENVGAVTFSEHYIRRGKATREDREQLASVILHEMAHMWFGDLVTMKWWNDLWLNESFATFMSALAVEASTPFKKSWESFFQSDKTWAYFEDQMVTTHPIEASVPDTGQAFANFDGITYGKGASVLKQLYFYIGREKFQRGVQNYFKKFAFKNAELTDFMGELGDAAGIDLIPWSNQWLRTAGLNTAKITFQCNNDKILGAELLQTATPELPTLREHRTQIAFYESSKDGKPKLGKVIDVTYGSTITAVADAVGLPCPQLIYTNASDYDYVKTQFDDVTLREVKKSISSIKDEFTRLTMWSSLWQMVRDAQLPVQEYGDIVLNQIGTEKEYKVLAEVLGTINGGRHGRPSILYYLNADGEKAQQTRASYVKKFEGLIWSTLLKPNQNLDTQKLWFDAYARTAQSPEAISNLMALVDKTSSAVPGLVLDQDRRWDAIVQISAYNPPEGRRLAENEVKNDHSNAGHLMAVAAEVAQPDLAVKKKWFNRLLTDQTTPYNQLRYAMWYLFPKAQDTLHDQFTDDFFKALPEVVVKKDDEFQETFSENLVPSLCSPRSVQKLSHAIDEGKDFTPIIMKNLKIARQEDERCIKVRALADGGR